MRRWALFVGALLVVSSWLEAQPSEWETRAEAHAQALKQKNGPGIDPALTQQLLKMRDDDQGIRMRLNSATPQERATLARQMDATDLRLTAELKQIVKDHGWPTIALVGSEASQAAAVILVHSPDHAWQAELLPSLRRLVEEDKIFGSDIATLTDKLLVSRGKPQVFGTQFKDVDEKMVMMPVIDPQHLDQRRAQYLLPPMSVYRALLHDMYHKPVE